MILKILDTPLNRIKCTLTPPVMLDYKEYLKDKNKYKKEEILNPRFIYSPRIPVSK